MIKQDNETTENTGKLYAEIKIPEQQRIPQNYTLKLYDGITGNLNDKTG